MPDKKNTAHADNQRLIQMGEVVGVHGVKGMVKMKIFAQEPTSLCSLSPLSDASGKKKYTLLSVQPHGNTFLVAIDGISDRTAAEKLRGLILHVPREKLPTIKDKKTFYHADLIGLAARGTDANKIGTIINVANFGAGDLLEIKPLKGASFYLPFTDAAVPDVQLAAGFVVIDPPEELL
jgi:16S rRNA processing protein RimM